MNAQDIKEIINENIEHQNENIKEWRKRVKKDISEGKDVFFTSHCLELAKEYREAYVDLLIQIERMEESE